MSIVIIPIDTSISTTNKPESFWDKQRRWAKEKTFEDIVSYVIGSVAGFISMGIVSRTVYFMWKKHFMIGFAIFLFVFDIFICVCTIRFLVMAIQALIEKCHHRYQQYHLQKPIKHNSSSRYAMNKWWLSKRDLRKLKMVMSEVSIQENQQFNV